MPRNLKERGEGEIMKHKAENRQVFEKRMDLGSVTGRTFKEKYIHI